MFAYVAVINNHTYIKTSNNLKFILFKELTLNIKFFNQIPV